MPESNANRRSRKQGWSARGLCGQCGRKPTEGRKLCEHCCKLSRDHRDRQREKGICKCGRAPVKGNRTCELCRENTRKHNDRVRHVAFMAYGGYECVCCGETTREFLQLDHIHDDGAEHRKANDIQAGTQFYWWLEKNNYPNDLIQVLCANCNYAKAFYGCCPHQRDKHGGEKNGSHKSPRQKSAARDLSQR